MTEQKDRIFRGIIYVCIAFFLITLQQALGKLLIGKHHVIDIAFYRSFCCFVPCLGYVFWTKKYQLLQTQMPRALTFRCLVGISGLVLTFAATQALPLSDATVMFFLSTLLVPIFAHFFLKEKVGIHRWGAVFIGMTGVLLVAQPSGAVTVLGIILAIGAAFTHAVVQITLRFLKTEHPFTVTMYFFGIGAIVTGALLPWFGKLPDAQSFIILLAIAFSGGIAQLFLTAGFQSAPTSLLSPFGYTGLLWATLLDIAVWGYIPDWTVFLGGIIIILSKMYILYREYRMHKALTVVESPSS